MKLHPVDIAILLIYVIGVVYLGFHLRKKASENVESYFLAGRRLHWLWISISGSVSTYDITGTMWIVAMFYTMGLKGMWIHWSWGFLIPAAYMTFAGKWVRRSAVLTGAQWMETRFGKGLDGMIARQLYAFASVITTVCMIAYDYQGIGKFISVYLPLSKDAGAFLVFGVTSIYVILGGLYSVIVTDVIQTAILTIAAAVVAVICASQFTFESLSASVPDGWLSLAPAWEPTYLAGTDFQFFGLLCIAWIAKGIMLNAGGPFTLHEFQRFLSTRSSRDASKVGAAWGFFLVTRWAMCIGITALAVVGIQGITDPEMALPHVLDVYLPIGLKGLVLAGFLAAFMSTFDSTINSGAAYLVEDIYHGLIKPNASNRELTRASYISSILIVIAGLLIGMQAQSITTIWTWILMVFTAGFLVPNILRWYWWRFNAWGVAGSTSVGMAVCFFLTFFYPGAPPYLSLGVIVLSSLAAAIIATYSTAPTNAETLRLFYGAVHPGGFWGPVRRGMDDGGLRAKSETFMRDLFNCAIGMIALLCLYLTPVYSVIHDWTAAAITFSVFLAGVLILWKTWYPYLPED
ncbi:MAG: hypothetical protein AB1656_24910 [Candidatus Omnitrophota bacterium]